MSIVIFASHLYEALMTERVKKDSIDKGEKEILHLLEN
jgi:hypothetical protein